MHTSGPPFLASHQYERTRMQSAVDAARAVLSDSGSGVPATPEAAKRLLQQSHRLAYTSFAPLLGTHLLADGPFQPPFPSIFHMQLSKLTSTAQCGPAMLRENNGPLLRSPDALGVR